MTLPPERAHAKINLHLHVTGRRADGYHLLDSLVVFAGAADHLTAEPADTLSLAIDGPFAPALGAEPAADNLVLRAARALAGAAGIEAGAAIRLEKNLPVASGIGGGSADAAATLRLLARLWDVQVPLPQDRLLALGADVPVCLRRRPVVMRGIGEDLLAAPALPPLALVLVNPLVPVPTHSVFRARSPAFRPPAELPDRWPDATAMARDLARLSNDLQDPALALAPAIGDVLAALQAQPGCLLARMSGSGATCFALFEPGPGAERAHANLAPAGWWVWHGGLAIA